MLRLLSNRSARRLAVRADRDTAFDVEGEVLPVQVKENPRSGRITLRLAPGGKGLKITMPPHVSDRQLHEFLERNRGWIAARRARLPEPTRLRDGSHILYRGREHRIVHLDRLRGVVETREIAGESCLLVPGEPDRLQRRLVEHMKRQARRELDLAVTRHAAILGVRARQIRITDTTSRWGSCSANRTLSFTWRIIMAPPEVLDYLAAHEVAHLREMNHSARFWNLVRDLCPEMERHKAWLKSHGQLLHAVELD